MIRDKEEITVYGEANIIERQKKIIVERHRKLQNR